MFSNYPAKACPRVSIGSSSKMASGFYINQRLSYSGSQCTVRYIGSVEGTKGEWLGVEWSTAEKGKHSGEYQGKKYFECKLPGTGSFIRPSREAESPVSFLEGLKRRYASSDESHTIISISANKVMEEVGFDKISEKLSQLRELRIVLVDGLKISTADDVEAIRETCPKIEELDLSRNLFEDFQSIAQICSALPNLKGLRINGNRFSSLDITVPEGQESPFKNVASLEISSTFFSWEETNQILSYFPKINTLESTLNNISSIPITLRLPTNIHTLNLERNSFTTLSAVFHLTTLTHLRKLILANNSITSILSSDDTPGAAPAFTSITHLDLSFNALPTLSSLDDLPPLFPALTSLRVSHNPFCILLPMEEAHMLTLARFPEKLKMLNYSVITEMERQNAEMYYLGRIAKELAAVSENGEEKVLARHARWEVLCELYGKPRIDRVAGMEKRNLGAKLIELEFIVNGGSATTVKRVPKSLLVSTLKALLGCMFGLEPLWLRLELVPEGDEANDKLLLEDGIKEVGYYVERKKGKILVQGRTW